MHAYLFFGAPGSGKGTQKDLLSDVLREKYGDSSYTIIETGQLLREMAEKKDTVVRRRLAEVMESGGLVPSAFPIGTWVHKLVRETAEWEHLIVDGAGRKLLEAIIIVELLQFFRSAETHIIFLEVPDDEVRKRLLLRGRVDDKDEVITTRLKLYKDTETGTTASINFLRENKDVMFHTIDGVGPIEEVHRRVLEKIKV